MIPGTAAINVGDWLKGVLFPAAGSTLKDQINCYNLPYGGIGFVSHILTYYTIAMTIYGYTCLLPRPWDRITHSWPALMLSFFSLVGTLSITVMNMVACHSRWEFVCMAVWKTRGNGDGPIRKITADFASFAFFPLAIGLRARAGRLRFCTGFILLARGCLC